MKNRVSSLLLGAHLGAAAATGDLADLSLEELGNLQITSVSKRAEPLSGAPASVFVLTAEDIRRAGATSIPQALRLAPNVQVAQVNATGYSITTRGFAGSQAANKLLVLIDGRSVYTPLFAGVFWDVQDVLLEDIDRIEVISGPGATLWGTNAVNGVINIITRSAQRSQGGLVAVGAGNEESGGALRYGGRLGADGHYRVYLKHGDRRPTDTADGREKPDGWHKTQLGARADWERSGDRLTVQGNAYEGAEGQPLPGSISIGGVRFALDTIDFSGLNLLARWDHALDDGANLMLQAYYDRSERTVPPTFGETLDIVDLQVQHSLRPIGRHAITWGLQARASRDRTTHGTPVFAFLPADVDQRWTSLFAQDEASLGTNLKLTVGARLERNDYTGTEFLPNARLAWTLAPEHMLWAAASRAVRAPSRLDRDIFVPASPPFLLDGGANVRAEIAKVVELGWRGRSGSALSYSVTAFHASYAHLRTTEVAPPGVVFFDSRMTGRSRGVEMWGSWQATRTWRLSAGLTNFHKRLALEPGSTDTGSIAALGGDPSHTWSLRSSLDLPQRVELDATVRKVAALPSPAVPSYVAADLRLGWRPNENLEFSVTGRNLFDGGHAEFRDLATRTEVGRGVFFKVAARF
jgi:iron complex outermembrane receptor protein